MSRTPNGHFPAAHRVTQSLASHEKIHNFPLWYDVTSVPVLAIGTSIYIRNVTGRNLNDPFIYCPASYLLLSQEQSVCSVLVGFVLKV